MNRLVIAWMVLGVLGLSGACGSLFVGAGSLDDADLATTFLRLRAGRLATAFLAGAALGTAGVLVQGLFRNPLASPSVIGTTAGASFGGTVALVLGETLSAGAAASTLGSTLGGVARELWLPLGCLGGALFGLCVLLVVTSRYPSGLVLLLTGFILSSLFLSATSLLSSIAQESWALGRAVVAFMLGGVDAKGAHHVALAAPLVVGGVIAAVGFRRHLDLLLSGEEEAASLGVDVRRVRRWVIIWAAALTAAAVSIGGSVSFVGLVVPHALRPFVGHGHGHLIPASFFGGGVFLICADVLARLAPTQGELPLGVVTGFVGAPLFLWLLLRGARQGRVA
ncbi:MAG: iron ABC transporter permease [Planctomycetota bacterium]